MDKLNLDISKYSCNELQDIFNINQIVNYEQVSDHINTYKTTIFSDSNLSLSNYKRENKLLIKGFIYICIIIKHFIPASSSSRFCIFCYTAFKEISMFNSI